MSNIKLLGCGTVRLKLFPSQFLETQRVKVREKESRQGQYWTALLPYSTFPASNTTHSHLSVQLNTSRTDSSALTHIYNEKCDWKPAKQSVFETHFICTSPFCMWGLEKSALECPKTVMSEFRFLTFLTLPGCLLPASQPLVSLISFDGTSRGKIRQARIHTASAKNCSAILRRYGNRSNPLFTWRELSRLAIIGRRKTKNLIDI